MNTRHAYSLQVDSLVFYSPLDHFNDGLIWVTWGKKWGDVGVRMRHMTAGGSSVAGWQALLILGQQHGKFKVSGAGNKGFTRQWGLVMGCLSTLGYSEGVWEACCILTLLGQCFSTSDTPGITRLLQLLGRVASKALTSHMRTEGGMVHSSNPTSGTAGVSSFFFLCIHTSTLTVHTHTHTHSHPWKWAHHPHTIRLTGLTVVTWSTR